MSHSEKASYAESKYSDNYPAAVKTMIQNGQDPKDMLIEICKPKCTHWEDRLKRCEIVLKSLVNADPEKTCMYTLRDWVSCVESCVSNF